VGKEVLNMKVAQMQDPKDLASIIERRSQLFNVLEIAQLLGRGKSTIYEWVAAGRVPYIRIGTTILFDPIKIARWLRDLSVEVAT
jgi:excisionase family DNA binding protein